MLCAISMFWVGCGAGVRARVVRWRHDSAAGCYALISPYRHGVSILCELGCNKLFAVCDVPVFPSPNRPGSGSPSTSVAVTTWHLPDLLLQSSVWFPTGGTLADIAYLNGQLTLATCNRNKLFLLRPPFAPGDSAACFLFTVANKGVWEIRRVEPLRNDLIILFVRTDSEHGKEECVVARFNPSTHQIVWAKHYRIQFAPNNLYTSEFALRANRQGIVMWTSTHMRSIICHLSVKTGLVKDAFSLQGTSVIICDAMPLPSGIRFVAEGVDKAGDGRFWLGFLDKCGIMNLQIFRIPSNILGGSSPIFVNGDILFLGYNTIIVRKAGKWRIYELIGGNSNYECRFSGGAFLWKKGVLFFGLLLGALKSISPWLRSEDIDICIKPSSALSCKRVSFTGTSTKVIVKARKVQLLKVGVEVLTTSGPQNCYVIGYVSESN